MPTTTTLLVALFVSRYAAVFELHRHRVGDPTHRHPRIFRGSFGLGARGRRPLRRSWVVAGWRLMNGANEEAVSRRRCGDVPVGAAPRAAMSARSPHWYPCGPLGPAQIPFAPGSGVLPGTGIPQAQTGPHGYQFGDRSGTHDASDHPLLVALLNSRNPAAVELHRRRVGETTHGEPNGLDLGLRLF
jgi:hypothetical protein